MQESWREYFFEVIKLQRGRPSLGLLQYRNLLTASQYRLLLRTVGRYLRADQHILDWGCGNGHFSYFLARQGFNVRAFSLDGRPPILDLVPPQRIEFVKGNKSEPVALPFPDACFDGAVSVGVLEHVRDSGGNEEDSLREIARVLKPGGLFIGYHLPNVWSWVEFISSFFPNKHHHRRRFTKGRLLGVLGSAGFVVLKIRSYGFLPRWLMGRCPAGLADVLPSAVLYNSADDLLGKALPFFCTNFFCVARKAGARKPGRFPERTTPGLRTVIGRSEE